MPSMLNGQRNSVALQAAEASVVASELKKKKKVSCPTGKIDHDGCCIYPLGTSAKGSWNYIIYNNCNAMIDAQLLFQVTTDMVAEYDIVLPNCGQTPPSGGTFQHLSTEGVVVQFNCYSKDVGKKKDTGGMVQYIFYVQGQTITPHIQYVSSTPDGVDHDWGPSAFSGITLPNDNALPAGYSVSLWLNTDDNGYVNEVIFGVQPTGGNWSYMTAPSANTYPLRVFEFQTNVVSTDGHYVHYKTGGAGRLYYTSNAQMNGYQNQQLCVEGGSYDHCVASYLGTCESSNASYGFPDFCCSSEKSAWTLSQSVVAVTD